MLSGASSHLLPESVSCSHQFAWLGTKRPWDKAKGLLQLLLGLVSYLPLAPDKLHYEHPAPHDFLAGGEVQAQPGKQKLRGVGAPINRYAVDGVGAP